MKDKETALNEYMEMIKKSWTYARLTDEERERMFEALRRTKLFGKFDQRCEQLHSVYYAFLLGVGYKPIDWREPEETPKF